MYINKSVHNIQGYSESGIIKSDSSASLYMYIHAMTSGTYDPLPYYSTVFLKPTTLID